MKTCFKSSAFKNTFSQKVNLSQNNLVLLEIINPWTDFDPWHVSHSISGLCFLWFNVQKIVLFLLIVSAHYYLSNSVCTVWIWGEKIRHITYLTCKKWIEVNLVCAECKSDHWCCWTSNHHKSHDDINHFGKKNV